MVLFGLQTELKEDLHGTAPELVYGTTLWLPGELFSNIGLTDTLDPASYVAKLKMSMQQLQASPLRMQNSAENLHKQRSSDQYACLCVPWCCMYVYCFNHHTMVLTVSWSVQIRISPWRSLITMRFCHWITSYLHRQYIQPSLAVSQE